MSVEVVVRHKRSAVAGIATTTDLIRQYVPELGDGARRVAMMTLILAGALSSYCRPSASALAAYEADPPCSCSAWTYAPLWNTPSPH